MTRHIVIITTSYPITSDGSEAAGAFAHDFVAALAKEASVSVIAPGQDNEIKNNGDVTIYRYWTPQGKPLSTLNPLNPVQLVQIARVLLAGFRAARMLHKSEAKLDFIFCLWIFPSGLWGSWLARKRKINYGTWSLGSDVWRLSRIAGLRQLLQSILSGSLVNFADGHQLCSDVKELSKEHCEFLPSCRNMPVLEKSINTTGPYKLGYLGRWHENKGTDILLDALSQLDEKAWDNISLVTIAGGGPLDELVRQGARELSDLGRPVEVKNYLGQEEAAEFIASHDYILLPSRLDSIPVIFSDALGNSSPLVSTPVGDMPALIDRYQCGVLADGFSASEFARAIKVAVSSNPGQFLGMREELMLEFSPGQSARKLLDNIE